MSEIFVLSEKLVHLDEGGQSRCICDCIRSGR